MCTSAHGGQAIGMAAALCVKSKRKPADFVEPEEVKKIQRALIATGQYIPQLKLNEFGGVASKAEITASSELKLSEIARGNSYFTLDYPVAMLLPFKDKVPHMQFIAKSETDTIIDVQIRTSIKNFNFTPDALLFQKSYTVTKGEQTIEVDFDELGIEKGYYFVCIMKNTAVQIAESNQLITGVMAVYNYQNPAVSNYGAQKPTEDIGVDSFEFWCPKRRPQGKNLAMKFEPTVESFDVENVRNEIFRPLIGANAWVSDLQDENPTLTLSWKNKEWISEIQLFFDTDSDHAMENVQMGHYDSAMPFCVKEYTITDDNGNVIYATSNNHQTINTIKLPDVIQTKRLKIEMKHPSDLTPAALYGVIIK
jgi:hypothetical protein